jgi:spoIIIJ-associated protein
VASSAEANARTVAAAVEAAAAKLGLRPDQVEVEVLKQPVPSTFGKVGEAAVVRVVALTAGEPAGSAVAVGVHQTAAAVGGGTEHSSATVAARSVADGQGSRSHTGRRHPEVTDPDVIAADTELAGDFVEGLLDVLDIDGDITTWVDAAGGHVDIEGPKLEFLVGLEGEILNALQELTRLAVLRQTQRWVRITVDVNGFKARRREEIAAMARETAERVAASRQDEELEPMTAFERKIVHDVIADIPGAQSSSVGEEPNRRVVVHPA